jgi:hypothetical protein
MSAKIKPSPTTSKVVEALREALAALELENEREGAIGDTLWMPNGYETIFEFMRAALESEEAPKEPSQGSVWVPVKPTNDMVAKAMNECGNIGRGSCGEHSGIDGDNMRSVWEAMLSAIPFAPRQQVVKDTERLDWIFRQSDEFFFQLLQDGPNDGKWWVAGMNGCDGTGDSPRAAVDAAIAAQAGRDGTA